MSWYKCDKQTVRTSTTYGVKPEYFGTGPYDGHFWQGKLGQEWVIVHHDNWGVHFTMGGYRLLLHVGDADYWHDANDSWFLYQWQSGGDWCLSKIYGRKTWESTAAYPVYTSASLPTPTTPAAFTCSIDGQALTQTLTWYFPHWTSTVQFGQYTPTGGATGNKTFGSPRWRQTTNDDFPEYYYRAVARLDGHTQFIPDDTSATEFPRLTYDETEQVWTYGTLPETGAYWQTDTEPVPGSPFTLTEYTRADDGQNGHTDTPTGQTLTYTADGYGQCPSDKTKILLVTPEITT